VGATLVIDNFYYCTGELVPDVTGTYDYDGDYADKPSYKLMTGSWFIWWDVGGQWVISQEKGVYIGVPSWTRTDPSITGDYLGVFGASGTATISLP
jgi:hypothetical protein